MKNIINMPTPTRERFLRRLDLLRSHPRKKLREQKYSYSFSLSRSKVDCYGNKLEMCLFPFCLTFIAFWGGGLDLTLLEPS
jgi:hypothetical protein